MPPLLTAAVQAGILTQEDAERLARSLDADYARLWAEQYLERSYAGALSAQQRRLLDLLQATGYQPTEAQLSAFWAEENRLLWEAVGDDIVEVMTERATIATVAAGLDTWTFVNQSVIDWAEDYYLGAADVPGSVKQLGEVARKEFAEKFTKWQVGGLDRNKRGLPDLIDAITPVFGPERAERIAVTETTRIFTEALRFAEERNPDTVAFRMYTAADEKVCPICGPLHTMTRKKAERSYLHPQLGRVSGPPFHVRCRCAEVPETALTIAEPLPEEEQWTFASP